MRKTISLSVAALLILSLVVFGFLEKNGERGQRGAPDVVHERQKHLEGNGCNDKNAKASPVAPVPIEEPSIPYPATDTREAYEN